MIIVTPYLVRPVSGQLALPTDGYRAPDRWPADLRRPDLSRATPAHQSPAAPGRAGGRRRPRRGSSCDRPHIGRMLDDALPNRRSRCWRRALRAGAANADLARRAVSTRSTCRSSPARTMRSTRRRPTDRSPPAKRAGSTPGSAGWTLATATRSMSTAPMPAPRATDVARVAGHYGMLVSDGAPVDPGMVAPGMVRVVVSRTRASVPDCPNWSVAVAAELRATQTMSQLRLRRELATWPRWSPIPKDLIHGREGSGVGRQADTARKAIRILPQRRRRPATKRPARTSAPRRASK